MRKTQLRVGLALLFSCLLATMSCGGDESKNECEEAKNVQMTAIKNKCAEIYDCCYCHCELDEVSECDCSSWSLRKNDDTSICQGGDITTANRCLNDEVSCADQVTAIVQQRCSM